MTIIDRLAQVRDAIFDPDSEAKANLDRAIMDSPLGGPIRAAETAIKRLDTIATAIQIGDVREFKGKPKFPARPLMGADKAPAEPKYREKGFYLDTERDIALPGDDR